MAEERRQSSDSEEGGKQSQTGPTSTGDATPAKDDELGNSVLDVLHNITDVISMLHSMVEEAACESQTKRLASLKEAGKVEMAKEMNGSTVVRLNSVGQQDGCYEYSDSVKEKVSSASETSSSSSVLIQGQVTKNTEKTRSLWDSIVLNPSPLQGRRESHSVKSTADLITQNSRQSEMKCTEHEFEICKTILDDLVNNVCSSEFF